MDTQKKNNFKRACNTRVNCAREKNAMIKSEMFVLKIILFWKIALKRISNLKKRQEEEIEQKWERDLELFPTVMYTCANSVTQHPSSVTIHPNGFKAH